MNTILFERLVYGGVLKGSEILVGFIELDLGKIYTSNQKK
jgi:hypothetical protein